MSKLKDVRSAHEESRERSQKLEARYTQIRGEVSELKAKASSIPQQSDPESDQLNNSLQILTCLKDVMMPYYSLCLPKDPKVMTREQKIVYHFLNEVQAATARQTPQVEPREIPVWRP